MALILLFLLDIDAPAPAELSNNSSPSQHFFFSFFKRFLYSFIFGGACCRCCSPLASYGKRGLLFAVDRVRALGARASVAVVHGLTRSGACGIFPDQGPNLCLLRWQADS